MPDITVTTYEGSVAAENLGYTVRVTDGVAIPPGGTTGQRLAKASDANYDYEWVDGSGGGSTVSVDADGTVTVDATTVELATDAQLTAHEADTTNVHGIADTSLLETAAGAQSKANAAQAAAEATAANADNLTSGTVADARIASTIARDSEVTAAISVSEAGQVRDGDAAGGVLAGTYPNPSFAVDMATQAELDAEAALARNADNLTSGTVADARIASTIARDSEVTAAISSSEAGQVRDGDAAGGVLSGTYPNPGFAADMATQAELDAHVNDTSAAHAASAISYNGAAGLSATDVEAALDELDTEKAAASHAHAQSDITNLTTDLAAKVPIARTINAQTGTSYTLVLSDAGKKVTMSNASASTLTVPPNSSVAYPTGTQIEFAQLGAGAVTVTPGSGVTISGTPDLIATQYQGGTLTKTGTDAWLCEWSADSSGGGGAVSTDTIWDAKGDLAVGTGSNTAARLPVGANDTILMADSAQSTGLKYNKGTWKLEIDDALSSTSGLLAAQAGTWGINSGVLRQSAAGKARISHATIPSAQSVMAMQVEVAYISGSGSARRIGILPNSNNIGSWQALFYLESSNGTTWTACFENDSVRGYVSGISTSYTGSGYVTLAAIGSGLAYDLYVDGAFIGKAQISRSTGEGYGTNEDRYRYVGMYTQDVTADYRNLKVWTGLPVPW